MSFPTASNATAFYAGIWAGIVAWFYLYFETVSSSVQDLNYAFLAASALCIVPTYPFVFGPRKFYTGAFKTQAKDRFADFSAVLRRCLIWLLAAGTVLLPYVYLTLWAGGDS